MTAAAAQSTLSFRRDTHLFSAQPALAEKLKHLRYTAASRMAKNDISAIAAGKVLGHNSLSMTEHYSKPDEEMTRDAVKNLWGSEAIGDNVAPVQNITDPNQRTLVDTSRLV